MAKAALYLDPSFFKNSSLNLISRNTDLGSGSVQLFKEQVTYPHTLNPSNVHEGMYLSRG